MGNNAAFKAFEATVIAAYNKGVLDKELLDNFGRFYRGRDIDRGGFTGALSNDGLDVDAIMLKVYDIAIPARPVLPDDHLVWTPEQYQQNEDWNNEVDALVHVITDGWGW